MRRSKRTASASRALLSVVLCSMDQIYSALACYWDHKDEVDRYLECQVQLAKELRREFGQPPLVAKLKQRGL